MSSNPAPKNKKPKRRSFDLSMLQDHAKKLGGQCMSKEYVNSTYKLLFCCKENHKWRATPLEILGKKNGVGSWCPECKKNS
jgi:hypothetical protein